MKKLLLWILIVISIFLTSPACAFFLSVQRLTIYGISKLYILYANGEHEEVTCTSVDYDVPMKDIEFQGNTYSASDTGARVSIGTLTVSRTDIDKIAVYVSRVEAEVDGETYVIPINGYMGLRDADLIQNMFVAYPAPITSWFGVVNHEPTWGALNSNSLMIQRSSNRFDVVANSPVDVTGKKVIIQYAGVFPEGLWGQLALE